MTKPTTLQTLLLTLGSALLATGCTITLDPAGGDDDAKCLELFETCVDLAGDSPGCDAVFEYCSGADSAGDDGGMPAPGCEDEYIECLATGIDPQVCEPLLEQCYGGGEEGGGEEGGGEEGGGEEGGGEGGCMDDPTSPECCLDCVPNPDCELLVQACNDWSPEGAGCEGLLDACYAGDCDAMLSSCYEAGGDQGICQDLTGCWDEPQPPPGDQCDELIDQCLDMSGDPDLCQEMYPECFDIDPPMPGSCAWYYGECTGQFAEPFCQESGQACEAGILPESFDCGLLFPEGCVGVSEQACAQAEEACLGGFFDIELCASINDPQGFVQQLAECNGWQ